MPCGRQRRSRHHQSTIKPATATNTRTSLIREIGVSFLKDPRQKLSGIREVQLIPPCSHLLLHLLLFKIYLNYASQRPPAGSMTQLPIFVMLWPASRLNELLLRRLIQVVVVHVSVDQSHHHVRPNVSASLLPYQQHLSLMQPTLFASLEK